MSDPIIPSSITSALTTIRNAQNNLLRSNARLDNATSNAVNHGLRPIAVSPSQGQMLSILCQLIGAQSVLEIGTLGAYSTIWFAESVPGIKVTSIEYNPRHRDVALENIKGMDNVEIILGAALDVLPKLADEGRKFDFVFIDADWNEQKEYFDWAVKMTRKGGCVFVDNVVRQLTEGEQGDPRAFALIDQIRSDDRVDATLMPAFNTPKQTISELVDGFIMAMVK